MTSAYLQTEALRTAMERALNSGRPATLSNFDSCRRAYERAEIEHYTNADHEEAVRRALQWRCWNAEKHLDGSYHISELVAAPLSFAFMVAAWAAVYCILCPATAHAGDTGLTQPADWGPFFVAAILLAAIIAWVVRGRRIKASDDDDYWTGA